MKQASGTGARRNRRSAVSLDAVVAQQRQTVALCHVCWLIAIGAYNVARDRAQIVASKTSSITIRMHSLNTVRPSGTQLGPARGRAAARRPRVVAPEERMRARAAPAAATQEQRTPAAADAYDKLKGVEVGAAVLAVAWWGAAWSACRGGRVSRIRASRVGGVALYLSTRK
jgi:hypothetical protein